MWNAGYPVEWKMEVGKRHQHIHSIHSITRDALTRSCDPRDVTSSISTSGSSLVSRDLIDQLQENGRVAVETAAVVTKLLSASLLNQAHRERFRSAVRLRHGEILDLKDRIAETGAGPDVSRVVSRLEALWDQIAERVEY